MKAIKVMATVDEKGQLALDEPIAIAKNIRVEVIVLVQEETEAEDNRSREEILQDFRQSWYEAMAGQTIPISQLWEGIEDA